MAGVARLDAFNAAEPDRYVPITTEAMRLAATRWAVARELGVATADQHALDGDVILAAQVDTWSNAHTFPIPVDQIIVATSNVKHIRRFTEADEWRNIIP